MSFILITTLKLWYILDPQLDLFETLIKKYILKHFNYFNAIFFSLKILYILLNTLKVHYSEKQSMGFTGLSNESMEQ